MRKIIVACCLLAISVHSFADQTIYLQVRGHEPILKGNGPRRMPQRPLMADLDGHTLTFGYGFDHVVTLELLDEDENLVYTNDLYPGQTTLLFPGSLSGEYVICLTIGSMCYIGAIEL